MPGHERDPSGVKIIDGAVRVLGDVGFRRATVELVAKYAGVSHMTIYRRWPSRNELLTTAIIGELTTLLDTAFGRACQICPEFADRSLIAFTDTVWAIQNHPIAIRELTGENGECSALLSSSASAVMDVTVPLITERLQRLEEGSGDGPANLDAVADTFVRLAYSLVTVRRTSQPLSSRTAVAAYASESFGPYLQGLPDENADDAPVSDLASRRSARDRDLRPYLQIAAACLVGVLTLGAGLTAVLGGGIANPFVSPANISRTGIPAAPADLPPGPPPGGSGSSTDPQVPGGSAEDRSAPGPSAADPAATPAGRPAAVPPAGPSRPGVVIVGSDGGNAGGNPGGDNAVGNLPVVADPAPPPRPTPGPQPPKPNPSPQPPKPAPQPPGPQPPRPGPNPAPTPPGPGQQGSRPGPGPGHGPAQ